MSCWTDGKLFNLVQLYSKFGNLWDRKHPSYDNLRSRYTSYSKILTSLSMPTYVSVSDVICKLKELRSIYVCELQKIESASKTGCIYKPNHAWFGIMNEFLYDYLDADEKLTEFSSSEEGTVSSEEILRVRKTKDCCSDSNSASESDSNNSLDPRDKNSLRKIVKRSKGPKKSQAYFLRSPTILRSTKMNTKYEFPRKIQASSMPVKNFYSQQGNDANKCTEDTQQCTRLDVKMTSSDVSIKYLRTENVNGDEKCYTKKMKGPLCSTDKPPCFKNIKMIISKSGYTAPSTRKKCDQTEDKDTEFWDMMSMLDLGVPCPLTKMETTYSPNTSCSSITGIDSQLYRNDRAPPKSSKTCCTSSCKGIIDENEVENIIKAVDAAKRKSETSNERYNSRKGCCSMIKMSGECEEVKKQEETLIEPCTKTMKVVCLGDGTLFDDNLLELLEDLSIKICPVDAGCVSGNCSTERPLDIFEDVLSCRTCSSATRPVKEFEMDAADSVPLTDETLSTTAENISENKMDSGVTGATTPQEKPADLQDESESITKSENDLDNLKVRMNVDKTTDHNNLTPSNIAEPKKFELSTQRNYDVKMILKSADSRSLSERDTILREAKKELWEAGKLYNSGKYVRHEIVDSGLKNERSSEFDSFGAQVASSLKMMGKQRAIKLKQMIADTLQGENKKCL